MERSIEIDELSERYERESKNVERDEIQKDGVHVREPHKFQPFTSVEDIKLRVMQSAQKAWQLNDSERNSYLNVHRFFYEFKPGETFFDFHDRQIYTVHPQLLEKKEQVQKMSNAEFYELGRSYYKARRDYLTEKRKLRLFGRKKSSQNDEDSNQSSSDSEGNGSDVFGDDQSGKGEISKDPKEQYFDRGFNFKWWKRVPVYGDEATYLGRSWRLEIYKETLEDIDPLFTEYPKHDIPHTDLFLTSFEKFSLWQTTRLFSMGFLCTFPLLVGMVMARQIPIFVGGGDIMKILKSKMVYKGGFHNTMNRREAGLILGVKQNATKEEIRARHRKLMIFNHPDNGGSQLIATKINEAKELMFKGDI